MNKTEASKARTNLGHIYTYEICNEKRYITIGTDFSFIHQIFIEKVL